LSATNPKGRFVRDLNPSDLVISDNGEPPDKITYFQTQTDLPLRVALVIDTSESVSFRFDFELKSTKGFLKEILRPDNDEALLVGFNQTATLVQPLTSDVASLNRGLKSLKANGETALFDAIALASDQLQPKAGDASPVRRAIVLVTDGEENSSHITLDQAVEHALRAEAVVYILNVKNASVTREDREGDHIIETLANATGGVVLRSADRGDMIASFRKIEQELRSQYALGYRPHHLMGDFFRSIRIFGPDGVRIRCREGYYPR
jgi:VWFA-related protein